MIGRARTHTCTIAHTLYTALVCIHVIIADSIIAPRICTGTRATPERWYAGAECVRVLVVSMAMQAGGGTHRVVWGAGMAACPVDTHR